MKKIISFFAALSIILSLSAVYAVDIDNMLKETAQYVYDTNKRPDFGSANGDWAVFALARCGYETDGNYYSDYYNRVRKYISENNGILSETRNTEYSRITIALTAIGHDCTDIDGYNLLTPLADFEKTTVQGINGAAWALIALDCGCYEMPVNSEANVQATRDMYVQYILDKTLPDGGFSYTGTGSAELDQTAIIIQALSSYTDRKDVRQTVYNALLCLSSMQEENGGFVSWGEENSEGIAQTVVALTSVGVPLDNDAFVKNGNTLTDRLMAFSVNGGFKHNFNDTAPDRMATEQCLYALAAAKRAEEGRNKLYDMSDVLPAKDIDSIYEEQEEVKYFTDTENSPYRNAVSRLAGMGIINGRTETEFVPEGTVTRAEFAAIAVRALNLEASGQSIFNDVTEKDWFYPYISAAYESGIVNGISDTEFNPNGTITREEAAVMTARAAEYNGCDTFMTEDAVRNTLAQFTDYTTVSEWAREPLAFCYASGILSQEDIEIAPKTPALRDQTAQMIYNMLTLI